MLIVCYADIDMLWHNADWHPYLRMLPKILQDRITTYKEVSQQQMRLTGKLLLTHILKSRSVNYSLAQLEYTPENKPYFPNSNFDFSITHSGNIVLCAFTDNGAIGIDAEKIKPVDIQTFKDVLTKAEWNNLKNAELPEQLFYDYWTRKEAILKATGFGISDDMNTIDVTSSKVNIGSKEWYLQPVDLSSDYAINIACDAFDHDIHIVEFSLYNVVL